MARFSGKKARFSYVLHFQLKERAKWRIKRMLRQKITSRNFNGEKLLKRYLLNNTLCIIYSCRMTSCHVRTLQAPVIDSKWRRTEFNMEARLIHLDPGSMMWCKWCAMQIQITTLLELTGTMQTYTSLPYVEVPLQKIV